MLKTAFENLRSRSPLIHNITNYVTVNDCANMVLACGASPIMADDAAEVEEITAICGGLNINIGTLNSRTVTSMLLAGKKANQLGHPVVLDPVGAGASHLRTDTAFRLLREVQFTVIRGNISEIKTLASGAGTTKGVDADVADKVTEENLDSAVAFAKAFAARTGAVVAITGAIDIVADAQKAYCIRNGNAMMSSITGTGCQLSALTAAFVTANPDHPLEAAAAAVCAMGLAGTWLAFLVIFIIAKIGYSGSLVFYDSMLGDVTTPERMDMVSSRGYAWGYIGSCVPFVVCLALVLGSSVVGLSQMTALSIALVITAVWWLAVTLPLLKKYRQINYVEVEQHAIRQSFVRIGQTLKHLPQDKQVFWFLLAFFCYIDGVYTIIDMATAYGTALGLDTTGLLLALLVTQIVAFPSALIFGRLSQKYASKTLIPVCIAAYTGIAVFAFFLKSQWQFWVLAVVVGMFQGGVQALSRSHFAKIIPQEKSGEYFGLFDICGKGASFLGTMIVSVGSQLTGSANVGVGSIAILFVIGFVLFSISTRTEETKQV